MAKRGSLYRCHLFSYAGPQTEGVEARWTREMRPVFEEVMPSGEIVEMLVEIDGTKQEVTPASRIRFDVLEEDFLLSGGADDRIVSHLGPGAAAGEDFPAKRKLLEFIEIGSDRHPGIVVRDFRRQHRDFMDYILVLKEFMDGPVYHLISWWETADQDDVAGNSEIYFIVNVDESFEDQSEATLEVSPERAPKPDQENIVLEVGDFGAATGIEPAPSPPPLTDSLVVVESDPQGVEVVVPKFTPRRATPSGSASATAGLNVDGGTGPPKPRAEHPAGPVSRDRIEVGTPKLQGHVLMILKKWDRVDIDSPRYAVAFDIRRAYAWGQMLFGSRAFAVFEGIEAKADAIQRAYWVFRTNAILNVPPVRPGKDTRTIRNRPIHGAGVHYFHNPYRDPDGRLYLCRTINASNDITLFTLSESLIEEFYLEIDYLNQTDPLGGVIPKERARQEVFAQVNAELAKPEPDNQRVATMLADLDVNAFRLLGKEERGKFVALLIKAWTHDREELALIELIKAAGDRTELDELMKWLEREKIKNQFINDLDDKIWSLLVTVGELFGGDIKLDYTFIIKLLVDSDVLTQVPGLTPGAGLLPLSGFEFKDGKVSITPQYADELETAIQALVQFVVGNFEGIKSLVTEPDKLVDGVIQLLHLCLTVELARHGHEPSLRSLQAMWDAIATQIKAAAKGVQILGVGEIVARRVKWAIIWEVISMVVGIGEVKAVISGLELGEHIGAVARLIRLLKFGRKSVPLAERLAVLLSRQAAHLGDERRILRLLSALPERDVRLLEKAFDGVDLSKVLKVEELAPGSEALKALEQVRPRIEALARVEGKVGRALTAEAEDGFRKLLRKPGLTNKELAELVDGLHDAHAEVFFTALNKVPEAELASGGLYSQGLLREIAARPVVGRMLAEDGGQELFAAMHGLADGSMPFLEQNVRGLGLARREVAAGGGDAAGFNNLLRSGDAGALRRLRDGRRAVVLVGERDIELAEQVNRALASQSRSELTGRMQQVRKRAAELQMAPEELSALERRIGALRDLERMNLPSQVPGLGRAGEHLMEAMHPDSWERVFGYGRSRLGNYRAGDATKKSRRISEVQGILQEELFYVSREYREVYARARQRAVDGGLDPNQVKFVRDVNATAISEKTGRATMPQLGDGCFVVEADGQVHVLTQFEMKSWSNADDIAGGFHGSRAKNLPTPHPDDPSPRQSSFLGQFNEDLERYGAGPARFEGTEYASRDIRVGPRSTEWVAVTPQGRPITQSFVDRMSHLNWVPYEHALPDQVLNSVAERVMRFLDTGL